MTQTDRDKITKWLAANLIPAPGSYVPAVHVRASLYEQTGLFVSITMLGHMVQGLRGQSGYGVLYLDHMLSS